MNRLNSNSVRPLLSDLVSHPLALSDPHLKQWQHTPFSLKTRVNMGLLFEDVVTVLTKANLVDFSSLTPRSEVDTQIKAQARYMASAGGSCLAAELSELADEMSRPSLHLLSVIDEMIDCLGCLSFYCYPISRSHLELYHQMYLVSRAYVGLFNELYPRWVDKQTERGRMCPSSFNEFIDPVDRLIEIFCI